jgi:hypothetical protein
VYKCTVVAVMMMSALLAPPPLPPPPPPPLLLLLLLLLPPPPHFAAAAAAVVMPSMATLDAPTSSSAVIPDLPRCTAVYHDFNGHDILPPNPPQVPTAEACCLKCQGELRILARASERPPPRCVTS